MRIVNQANIDKIVQRIESLLQKTEILHDDGLVQSVDHEWYKQKVKQLTSLSRRSDLLYAELACLVQQLNDEYRITTSRVAHDARRLKNVIKLK